MACVAWCGIGNQKLRLSSKNTGLHGFMISVMDVVNVVVIYFIITSDPTNEFLPGDNKEPLNKIELNFSTK